MSNLLVVKDKVQRWAREVYDDVRIDGDGDIYIPFDETVVWIRVWERSFDSADQEKFYEDNQLAKVRINIWGYVLVNVAGSEALYKWVAIDGQDMIVGHFALASEDEAGSSYRIVFADQIPGDALDPGELKEALLAVVSTTGDAIEMLKPMFGGKTFGEATSQ